MVIRSKKKSVSARFPDVLRELRLGKGWTQEELAHRSGLHYSYISQIECGKKSPSLRSITLLAGALGISISAFIKKMEI